MNIPYEKLPLVNLNALKVESHRSRAGKTPSEESVKQDNNDAEKVMRINYLEVADYKRFILRL